ncbi:hypothetical protein [Streptomyces sp. NPDC000134]|uniref:hypothetical protein n=1 Tax=Streptomyces sp. NPDC000134 TaxID=3364536 RepID=UPI00369C35DF
MRTTPPAPQLVVAAVGSHERLERAVTSAVRWATGTATPAAERPRLDEPTARRARRAAAVLRPLLARSAVRVVRAAALADLARELGERPGTDGAGGQPVQRRLVVVLAGDGGREEFAPVLEEEITRVLSALPAQVRPEGFFYDVLVYTAEMPDHGYVTGRYRYRKVPAETGVWSADIVSALADFARIRLRPGSGPTEPKVPKALARALHSFLTARAGAEWGFGSYPGSVTARFVSDLEELAATTGNPVLRSPDEHGLASGSMARWILDRAPFVICATSGMVDELRGTLANLVYAGARGFLLFADVRGGWFPFQGTVHEHENSDDVFAARGLPVVHLHSAGGLRQDLARAFEEYDRGTGPVVLMVTPAVLAYEDEGFEVPFPAARRRPAARARSRARITARRDHAAEVLSLINDGPSRLLWQCGGLTAGESDLCHELARRCGAALCDSLTRPGTVARYRDGEVVPAYLGSLGKYGYSASVYNYLHDATGLRPKEDQCVFFLPSRLEEAVTPFTAPVLAERLRTVQVSRNPRHLAPFVTHPLEAELEPFLRWLAGRVSVGTDLLETRRAAIEEARATAHADEGLRVFPMGAEFFFHRLNDIVEHLITSVGYTYTSVVDVGRAGASAVRNLARTGPGFSGWYGRSLMGDALSAVPAIATSRPGNVMAFVGDAAWMLVPDVIPTLVRQLCIDKVRMRGNLSLFRLINGAHSLINTWAETRRHTSPNSNTMVLTLLQEEGERRYGPVTVRHRLIRDIDDLRKADLPARLRQPETIDVYSVVLAHDNAGDGLSLDTENDWRHGTREVPLW